MNPHLRPLFCALSIALVLACSVRASEAVPAVSDLYREDPGTNPSFQELLEQKKIVVGEKKGEEPIEGTRIHVNRSLLYSNMDRVNGTVKPNRIHTEVNSTVPPRDFEKYSRWYQEDGDTQIFRLFASDQSVRSADHLKAGRIEAVKDIRLTPGNWITWEGTYTLMKGGGCLFQLLVKKNPATGVGGLWPVHIDAAPDGNIYMRRRRPKVGEETLVLLAKDAIGKNVTIRVCFDGKTNYKVYRKIHGEDKDFALVGTGTYAENYGDKVTFRWGIYQGSKPGSQAHDALVFVTGVKISQTSKEP